MDGSQFDRLARALGAMRSRRTAVAVMAGALATSVAGERAVQGKRKKRKKKCAKTCKDGCCTSKRGKCIKPAQQSTTRCGAGGGICKSTGCRCSDTLPCPVGQCCDGAGTCGECKVFATSTLGPGDIGGLAGADAECQRLANAAGLPGTYLAWLSDFDDSPASRFTKATVAYTLPDGQVVANSWADLTSGNPLRHAIDQIETGEEVTGTGASAFRAWTNTTGNGDAGGDDPNGNCADWTTDSAAPTGNFGKTTSTTQWTAGEFQQCPAEARLYCFQQR
jgi:hypothetical protein